MMAGAWSVAEPKVTKDLSVSVVTLDAATEPYCGPGTGQA